MVKLYNNDDIQRMITAVKRDKELCAKLFEQLAIMGVCMSDTVAIGHVLKDGWYETFCRYDSAVCDHFIRAYELAKGRCLYAD